jgi:hypothetical protein
MVRRHSEPHKSVGYGQRLIHVHKRVGELAEDAIGRVETSGTGADHSESQRAVGSLGLLCDCGIASWSQCAPSEAEELAVRHCVRRAVGWEEGRGW